MLYLCNRKRNKQQTKKQSVMKKFLINFKEVTYGVVEVFAENEDEAREIAETDGMRYDDNSEMELGELVSEEDIDEE